jgi:hypothetical protein
LRELGSAVDVVSVGAFFGDFGGDSWELPPDHAVNSPAEIVEIVRDGSGG